MVVSSGREIIGSECECLWRKTWDVRLGTRGCSPPEKKISDRGSYRLVQRSLRVFVTVVETGR